LKNLILMRFLDGRKSKQVSALINTTRIINIAFAELLAITVTTVNYSTIEDEELLGELGTAVL
jgi:hypothetical protein